LLLGVLFLTTKPVLADGGAPNLAYIAGTASGISVVDIQQQKVTSSFSLTGDAHTIYLSLDGRFLYVTQPALNRVTMLAAKTGQMICTVNVPGQPSLLAYDPGANVLYAAGNGAASVTEFDPNNCALKRTIKTGGPVYGLAVANIGTGGNGNQLWVSASSALEIFDNRGRIATIAIPGGAQYVSIPPGVMVYVTTQQGQVYAVNLGTHEVLPPLLSGGRFGPMDYDAYTDQVYVPDMLNKQVDVLAPIVSSTPPYPHEPDHVIRVGVAPQSVAITSDGQIGFIALQGGNVALLDIPGRQIYNTIFVGGNPRFIITGLYPPVFGTTPQEVSIWGTVINIVAYALVFVLLIVPIIFIGRRMRSTPNKKKERPTQLEDDLWREKERPPTVTRIGQQLGNYRLTRLLGTGGFAEVYLGEHVYLKTQAAIKVLQIRLGHDDVQTFLQEAQIIAHLDHPHIVRVLDFGIEEDNPFLVMNYAQNGSVREHYPKGTILPSTTILTLVGQVAAALQYAHAQKIIHRDIKPENMLLAQDNTLLLSDFGIAVVDRSTASQRTQNGAGTPSYMAPEQWQGKPQPASDQYALGVVVYEWLCGDLPFNGSFAEIAMQHMQMPPPSLCERNSTILPTVEQVVLRALSKDPQQRFESVQAFATALEQAYQSEMQTE